MKNGKKIKLLVVHWKILKFRNTVEMLLEQNVF